MLLPKKINRLIRKYIKEYLPESDNLYDGYDFTIKWTNFTASKPVIFLVPRRSPFILTSIAALMDMRITDQDMLFLYLEHTSTKERIHRVWVSLATGVFTSIEDMPNIKIPPIPVPDMPSNVQRLAASDHVVIEGAISSTHLPDNSFFKKPILPPSCAKKSVTFATTLPVINEEVHVSLPLG